MMDKEAREKIPNSFRIPLRALLWEYGVYKTVRQDEIIDTMFFNGYRKLPQNKPPLLSDGEVGEIVGGCKQWFEVPGKIAQAQREVCIKHYEGEE